MEMLDIIIKKRDGGELTPEEIKYWITGYTAGDIPDYQVAALLMAIYFNGMSDEETYALTSEMQHSGDEIDLSEISGIKVDKHSTGGVGDKTTLIVAPIVAEAGVKVAKMSGRGLGYTGGTADKLESIPGFKVQIGSGDFLRQVEDIGVAVITQTEHITPADKLLYALRDVTGTVANKSLIASSIMSKKLASGADAIVLDVKCGSGAFLRTEEAAAELADIMLRIGKSAGRAVTAVISDMDQPLGKAVGNSLEVIEAIDVLKGNGPEDITEISLVLAAEMIYLAGKAESPDEGYAIAKAILESRKGLERLGLMIAAQGGDPKVIEDTSLLGTAAFTKEVVADRSGYITDIDAEQTGIASQHTGAGRMRKGEAIDPCAGVLFLKKCGDEVAEGDVIAKVFADDENKLADGAEKLERAIRISDEACAQKPLIKRIMRNS